MTQCILNIAVQSPLNDLFAFLAYYFVGRVAEMQHGAK